MNDTRIYLLNIHFFLILQFIISYCRISLNAPDTFFYMNSPSAITRSGYKTIITLKPTGFETLLTEDELSIDKRKCRFSHEVPENMTLFKRYTKNGCHFECIAEYRYVIFFCIYLFFCVILSS